MLVLFSSHFLQLEERGRSELFITKSPFSYATYISLHGNGIMRESNFTWHILQVSIRSIRALHIYSIPLHSLRQCFQCLQKGRLYLSRGRLMTTQQVQTAASPWTFKNDEQKTWNMYKLPKTLFNYGRFKQFAPIAVAFIYYFNAR